MSAHLSTRDIKKYRSKAVTADEVRVIESHLSECEECRRSSLNQESVDAGYELVKQSLRSASQSPQPHIAYEDLAAYVDGRLDAIACDAIEAHVNACSDCGTDVVEFQRLRDAIRSDESPVSAAGPFWQRTAFRIGLEALAALLFIVVVGWFSFREIQSLRAENEQLRKAVSESEPAIADMKSRMDAAGLAVDRGSTGTGPEITLQLRDGEDLVTIDSQGALHGLESLPQGDFQAVKKVLETGRVSLPPVIAQLGGGSDLTMNGNTDEPGFSLSSPIGVVVETARPAFRWTKFVDAADYEVSVSDVKGKVVQRAKVSATSWRPSTLLVRGRIYQWQVRAITKDGREIKSPRVGAPDAKFRVLDRSTFNEIEQARSAYSGSHLVLGTVYARAGLVDEARREFRSLLEANPESQVSRSILGSLNRR